MKTYLCVGRIGDAYHTKRIEPGDEVTLVTGERTRAEDVHRKEIGYDPLSGPCYEDYLLVADERGSTHLIRDRDIWRVNGEIVQDLPPDQLLAASLAYSGFKLAPDAFKQWHPGEWGVSILTDINGEEIVEELYFEVGSQGALTWEDFFHRTPMGNLNDPNTILDRLHALQEAVKRGTLDTFTTPKRPKPSLS